MFKSLDRSISAPIAIIIIVVSAVIVGGGILVYQYKFAPEESEFTLTPPPKDETADWKTYRNEEYGYEIKYPKDWEARDYTQENCFPQNPCVSSIGIHSPIPTDWIGVAIFDNPDMLSVKDWLSKFRKLEELEKLEEFSLKEVEIGGTKGLRLTYLPSRPGAVTLQDAIYISKRGFVYMILLPGLPSPEIQEAIDQILSTFRFFQKEEIKTGKFEIDYNEIAKIQERVDKGSQPFYLTPDVIPWYLGSEYGFDVRDSTWSSKRISGSENAEEIKYEVTYKGKSYVFTVIQPVKGEYKIWIISEIQEK